MTTTPNPGSEEVLAEELWVQTFSEPPREPRVTTPPPPRPSIPALVEAAVNNGKAFIEAQIELTKIKAKKAATKAGGAIGAFVVAAILALNFLWWTFHTGEVALALVVPAWAASLIIWGILLVLIIILALVGVMLLKRAQEEAPDPKEMVKEDVEAVKEGLGK